MGETVLFGVCELGLGHTMRALPLVRRLYREGYKIILFSRDRPVEVFRAEFGDSIEYVEAPPYPSVFTLIPGMFLPKFFSKIPEFLRQISAENKVVEKIVKDRKVSVVVSDSRLGCFSRAVPSFLIYNMLRFIVPLCLRRVFGWLERVTEYANYKLSAGFTKIIVSDFEDEDRNFLGDMAHNLRLYEPERIEYIGPVSDFEPMEIEEDLDLYISVSAPEPARTVFENLIFSQLGEFLERFPGAKVAVTLGRPEARVARRFPGVEVYPFVKERKERTRLMNRAKVVLARGGHTVISDIVNLGKKAFFVPIPWYTEQEYEAFRLKERGYFHAVSQRRFCLWRDYEVALRMKNLNLRGISEQSVENFMRVINGKKPIFVRRLAW